ncbi:hypothetical protein [Bradyrhizobium sp. WD16]|uniref:hypothetical protein n=1 Tax=Bradyrhizobium sp. WD16 TaxID=1521768 RepID=UPI0020A34117|nr:hypothetical protein [Bradyrhizobium sp. WD16]
MSGRNPSCGSRAGFLDQRIRTLAREYSELVRLRDLVKQAEAIQKNRRRSTGMAGEARGAKTSGARRIR